MDKFESSTRVKRVEKARLTSQESDVIANAINAKPTWTYTIPATTLARCYKCQAVIALVTVAAGWDENVDLEIDQGQPRATLTSPHRCTELSGAGQ